MESRAGHFVAQAASDLRQAQAMARSDRSGQALGTAMYLCQQSVEKALKSVLLRLDERLGMGAGGREVRSLGHGLYHRLHGLYRDNVDSLGLPRLPPDYERRIGMRDAAGQAAARDLRCFEGLSRSWDGRLAGGRIRLLEWRHSLGVPLDEGALRELNSLHMPTLRRLHASIFGDARRPVPLANEGRPSSLCARILGRGLSKADYDGYVAGRAYAPMHSTLHGTYRMARDFFDPRSEEAPDISGVPRAEIGRRAILEFGFRALALAAHPYSALHPHGTLGRYPERLDDGRFTVDVYGEQAEYAIRLIFLEGEYLVWALCATTAHIDKLWAQGRGAGLW